MTIRFNNIVSMNSYRILRERKITNVLRYMKIYGLRNKDLADILNTQEPNVSDMLKGKRGITEATLEVLADYAKIDAAFFYDDPESPKHITEEEGKMLELYKNAEAHNLTKEVEAYIAFRIAQFHEGKEHGSDGANNRITEERQKRIRDRRQKRVSVQKEVKGRKSNMR